MIQDIHAEQAVIGTILMEGSLFDTLQLKPEHFYDNRHKTIYEAMIQVHQKDQDVNVITVTSALESKIQNIGGVTYLTDLSGSVPSTESLKNYEQLVFEAYRNRKSREAALKYAENPNDENLTKFAGQLEKIQQTGLQHEEKSMYDHLMEIAEDMTNPPDDTKRGFPTGYTDFDKMTGGLQPSDLIIIAARPSVGKTAFALNIAAGHCSHYGDSHIFSLEMGTKQLLQRFISSEANVDGQKWRSMNFSSEDYENAMQGIGVIAEWGLNVYDKITNINEIKANIRAAVRKKPDGKHLFIIDYLQLMTTTGKFERRDLEVGAMTRELKQLARELDVPIILLSQLSRGVEQRQNKRPMMSDLRESGNIEQDADVVGFLYRDDYYDAETEKPNVIEIILSKQRNGPTGTIELAFIKEYGKFVNLDYRYSNQEAVENG